MAAKQGAIVKLILVLFGEYQDLIWASIRWGKDGIRTAIDVIYVAEILDQKFIKVGFTSGDDASKRMSELQTGCPFEIRVVFTVEGTLRQEQSIHAALTIALTRCGLPFPPNEWYPGRNKVIQDFLEHLRMGANQGIMFAERYNENVKQPSPKHGERLPNVKWPTIGGKRRDGDSDFRKRDSREQPSSSAMH